MPHSPAYLLVFHGSRDPRSQAAAIGLTELFRQRIQYVGHPALLGDRSGSPANYAGFVASGFGLPTLADAEPEPSTVPLVGTAFLECTPIPLHQQIAEFIRTQEITALRVLPVFLSPGVHVMEDIPTEVAIAQQTLAGTVTIDMAPYLGTHTRLRRLLTERMSLLPMSAWILMAHGSRRPGANTAIDAVADHLGAVAAYWLTPPSLQSRLEELQQVGCRTVGILPYFLFPGGTTDAIAETLAELSPQFPDLQLHLTPPLEASPELADLLIELATRPL
ncbi:sirohydrochlorin chelatase [Pantanalinema sp. GBBB05]|uniref:sirohydrochlorin chelatase n=1 Tax=Pantanalinema sp. GBBB05 TaxID=2604139 RepID=UPI001D5001E8|nr:sirohydrochlorin chelatase [Pantanalinema sp. GBBB05]